MELFSFQEYRVKNKLNPLRKGKYPSPFSVFGPNESNIKPASSIQGVPEKKTLFSEILGFGSFWTVLDCPELSI